jgi:choline-phosphate cytidylyltransferase
LAFPSVYLLVGLFPDDPLGLNGMPTQNSVIERCEVVRHCRWVDEVIEDAPVVIDDAFLAQRGIDYVAVDEGTSCDPTCSKARLYGYDELKRAGK